MATVTTNYQQVQRQLRATAPAVRKALNRDLRGYALVVAGQAKRNASWSAQIPKSIGVTVTSRYAAVRVRGTLGPLYERGGKGRGSTEWRHPLFGDRDHWYTQHARPFLAPAIASTEKTAIAAMGRALDAAMKAV